MCGSCFRNASIRSCFRKKKNGKREHHHAYGFCFDHGSRYIPVCRCNTSISLIPHHLILHLLLLLPDRLIVPRCRSAHAICSLSRESMARGTRPAGSGQGTLRASLSATFLQTLPDLVTPLKGHSLSPRSCPPTRKTTNESAKYETIEAFFALCA